MLLLSTAFGQGYGCAHDNSSGYRPPVLKAPYTLVFSVQVESPNRILRKSTPVKSQQTGTLTLSAKGKRLLYLAKFGKWRNTIICDMATDTEYYYDNRYGNAIIQPGANMWVSLMNLLPMPGVGYDFYPMFQSLKYSSTGPSFATMASIGAVTSVTDNYIQGMKYQDTLVGLSREAQPPTVSSCKMMVTGKPALVEQAWKFSGYRMLGSVPVAGKIDHVLNVSSIDGLWPPHGMKRDGEIRYTLLTLSAAPLPDRQYNLETYLPPNCAVSDARKSP